MNPRRVKAVLLRQIFLIRGSFARVLPMFIWAAIDVILWGFITRYFNSFASPGVDLVPALLGAVLLWDFFARVMHGVTTAFLEDVWSRNFVNFFATPLTVAEYVTGLVITSVGSSAVGLVVMLLIAVLGFGLSILSYGLWGVAFMLVLFVFGIALGITGSAIILRLGPASEWFVWPLPAILSPFAGVFYPLSALPFWMQAVSRLLPPAYVFEGVRGIARGGAASGAELAGGAVLSLLYLNMASWHFTRTYQHAVANGLLARYTAESVA